MINALKQAEDPTRHLLLQYLVLAFSRLQVRDEALRCLEDLFTFLAADPAARLPEGETRGELGSAYLESLSHNGQCREFDFQWLRDDPAFRGTLERYRGQLQERAPERPAA